MNEGIDGIDGIDVASRPLGGVLARTEAVPEQHRSLLNNRTLRRQGHRTQRVPSGALGLAVMVWFLCPRLLDRLERDAVTVLCPDRPLHFA